MRKEVRQIDLDGNVIATFKSVAEAARELGISPSNIYACVAGRIKKTGGFKWKFVEPETGVPLETKPLEPSEEKKGRKFFCQCCGKKELPKHRFSVCDSCIKLMVIEKEGGKLPNVVYIPVKRPVLASVVERALEYLTEREK